MTGNGRAEQRGFRIWVNGRLSEHFSAGLTGVDQRDEADGTVLSGDYVDESHLQGVLDRLRNLGIGVRRFEVEDAGPPAVGGPPDVPPEQPQAST